MTGVSFRAALASGVLAGAASAAPLRIELPAGTLASAIVALSRQTGISVGVAGALPQLHTPKVKGRMEPGEALDRLVAGSGFRAIDAGKGIWRIEERPVPAPIAAAPPSDLAPPDDIIVTATKRGERLSTLPISIGVIQAKRLDEPSVEPGAVDALARAEGAFATNLGPGRNRIFLRGVADSPFNGPTQSTVGLYLDDARVSYATPDPDLRLVDIDRIEVLRGPQGTLYGTGSLGGIVRIVTTLPEFDSWSGAASVEGSLTGSDGLGGAGDAVLNAPLIAGKLALRIVGYGEVTPGWIDDSQRGDTDINRVTRAGGRIALRWQAAPGWTVDLSLIGQRLDARDSQWASSGLTRATAIAEPHDNDFTAGRAEVHGAIGDYDFQSSTAIVAHEIGSRFDASAVAASRGVSAPLAYDDGQTMTLISQEVRLSDQKARRPWVLGVSVIDVGNHSTGSFTPIGGPSVVARDKRDRSVEAALFGEATQPIGRDVDLTFGLRGFYSTEDTEAVVSELHTNKLGLTPSATLAWRPGRGGLLWLRYASAVRPGGLNDDRTGGRISFHSDELKSVELGGRTMLFRGHVSINAALFALHWAGLQSDIIGPDGLVETINAGTATNIGGELTVEARLAPFRIEGGMTAQHGRLESTAAAGVVGDSRLPVVPDFSAHLTLSAAHTFPDGVAGDAYVSARYVGPSRLSFDPGLARSMGEYAAIDAGVAAERDGWAMTLGLSNILNERGDTFGFGNPFTIRLAKQVTPLRPRTLSIGIARKF